MEADPRRPAPNRRTRSAAAVAVTIAMSLGLATLLNSQALLETARRQPADGAVGRLAVGVMEPIAGLSDAVGLDLPRELLDRALGRGLLAGEGGSPGEDLAVAAIEPEPTSTSVEGATTTSTVDSPPDTPSISTTSTTSTTTTSTTTTVPSRVPTPEDPLRVWIIGDSFAELLGPALRNDADETGVIDVEIDFRFISGLSRPDYFDWPARIRERMPQVEPDVVVVQFGGNDAVGIRLGDDLRVPRDSPEWKIVYADLVGGTMDLLIRLGADRVYWVGLPIMRSAAFTETVIGLNSIYRSEAEQRPAVVYVSAFEVFQDDGGEYSTYLTNDEGRLRRMRMPDGAHYDWPGAYRLAAVILETIASDWGLGGG